MKKLMKEDQRVQDIAQKKQPATTSLHKVKVTIMVFLFLMKNMHMAKTTELARDFLVLFPLHLSFFEKCFRKPYGSLAILA